MSIFSSLEAALMGKSGGQAEQGDDRLEGLEVASIDPYDQGAVKRTLDDGIVDILVRERGMAEDHSMSNSHLGIMLAACAVALVGQFWPWGFPDGKWGIAGCVVVYFILSNGLTLYQTFVEGDCIFVSRPVTGTSDLPVRVRTGMVKHENRFVVVVEKPGIPRERRAAAASSALMELIAPVLGETGVALLGAASGAAAPSAEADFVTLQHDFGRYFTAEGVLVRSVLRTDVAELLERARWLPAEVRGRQADAAQSIQRAFRTARGDGRFEGDVPAGSS